jgi:hypothetical protein
MTSYGSQPPGIDDQACRSRSGAAQESNLPSRGLHDLTGFEDLLRQVKLRRKAAR